jgi:hypothetical protein
MTSSGDALLLLKKWKSEKSPICVHLALSFGMASFFGNVAELDAPTLSLRVVGYNPRFDFFFNLGDAEFHYGDARSMPKWLEHEGQQYEHYLTAKTKSRDTVTFYEIRPKS